MTEPLTPLERSVLARFFSRVEPRDHADIYLVRKLPQEIRATLNGLYSRSRLSMRRTFLRRLQRGLTEQGKTLAELPLPEASEDVLAKFLVDKSGKFLRTYAIDHGHNSLREGAVLHLAVENVSQLVTRFIQRERRASFEESSTRYISFSSEGHWRDPEIVAAGEPWSSSYEAVIRDSFAFYRESIDALQDHIRTKRPRAADEDETSWARAVRAEAFDSARYLLTPALYTKFGIVADARTTADLVTRLLSHPLAEFRVIGQRIREEAEREVPTLLTHARDNTYLRETRERLDSIAQSLERPASETPPQARDLDVRLLSAPADLDRRLLASLVYEHANVPLAELHQRIDELQPDECERLFEQTLAARGRRDAVPEGLEGGGLFDFEILMDFGAYRDIARHRKGFQQQQAMTTQHGFAVPPLFDEAGLGKRYRDLLTKVAEHAQRLQERFPRQTAYVIPFAFLQRVRIQFDTRQMAYFLELRSAPEGHFSYRDIAIRMGHALRERAPLYARWVRLCEDNVFLGRAESEQGTAERKARREEQARRLGFET